MVATMTRQPKPTIADAAHADQARARLADLDRRIADLDRKREDVTAELGQAMAARELGDKKAAARVGQLSMKRTGLDAERADLQLTREAVRATLADWELDDAGRRGRAALADLDRLAAEARTVEQRLAEQMRAVGETARRLVQLQTAYGEAHEQALRHRANFANVPPAPRNAVGCGLQPRLIDDPDQTIEIWLQNGG